MKRLKIPNGIFLSNEEAHRLKTDLNEILEYLYDAWRDPEADAEHNNNIRREIYPELQQMLISLTELEIHHEENT